MYIYIICIRYVVYIHICILLFAYINIYFTHSEHKKLFLFQVLLISYVTSITDIGKTLKMNK